MTISEHLEALIACPRCDRPLDKRAGDTLRCRPCEVAYPLLDGVPWLFAEPQAALADWRQRLHYAIRHEQEAVAAIDAARHDAQKKPIELTTQRLQQLRRAHEFQAEALEQILAPLGVARESADLATYRALRTRLPPDQGLNTYYPNIHRDWAWGDAENEAAAELVIAAVDVTGAPSSLKCLVPGAGAGRLAADLHRRLEPATTVALDFNPLLILLAARLCAGQTVELYEFPIAPRQLADHAVKRTLRGQRARDGLEFVLGDALRAPFQPGSFDLIVTPWLIDIITEELAAFAPRINHLLKPGGQWIHFGSLAFRHADPAVCYSMEETSAVIAKSGFEEPSTNEAEIPYMQSPASRHARVERVVTLAMHKTLSVQPPKKHRALPDWIVVGKSAVPLTASFEMQAASTRIHAFIMSLIDGKRSLDDMAALMEQQKLMPRSEARDAIRGFLIKMYDDSRRYSGY